MAAPSTPHDLHKAHCPYCFGDLDFDKNGVDISGIDKGAFSVPARCPSCERRFITSITFDWLAWTTELACVE